MTTAPLLYVCVRPQQGAAAAEYESFRTAVQLDQTQLAQHDLVRDPLPDDVFERYSGFFIGGSPFNVTDPESTKTEVQRRLEADLERIARGRDGRTDVELARGAVHVLQHRRRHPHARGRGQSRATPRTPDR